MPISYSNVTGEPLMSTLIKVPVSYGKTWNGICLLWIVNTLRIVTQISYTLCCVTAVKMF